MLRKVIACGLVFLGLMGAGVALAAPAGYTAYYVPGNEQLIADMYRDMYPGQTMYNQTMRVVAVTISRDNTRIYYDHWEDGYDPGLVNFPPNANQDSTEVYDGDFGDTFMFQSRNIPVDSASYLPPSGSGRNPAYIDTYNIPGYTQHDGNFPYDGRDRIVSAGAPTFSATIAGIHWTEDEIFPNQDTWELFPIKPLANSYTLIHGADLAQSPYNYNDFDKNYLFVTAVAANTEVNIDDPATTGVDLTITLGAGECYLYNGGASGDEYNFSTGTTVATTGGNPIMVNTATSLPDELVVANFFVALPEILLGNDYLTSLPSDSQLYIHNPNDQAIDIQFDDGAAPIYGNLPAGATLSIPDLFSIPTPENTGVRLRSLPLGDGPNFHALGIGDTGSSSADSGWTIYSALGDEYFVPIGLESFSHTIDDMGNPVYITALEDETTFYVDYNHDSVVDAEFTADAYECYKIWDKLIRVASDTSDAGGFDGNDNTGANIYASAPFSAIWAQAPDEMIPDNYDFIDAAYTINPMTYAFITEAFNIEKEPDRELTCEGQAVRWDVATMSFIWALDVAEVVDTLPADWTYVTGSGAYMAPGEDPVPVEPTIEQVGDQQKLTFTIAMSLGQGQTGLVSFEATCHGELGNVYNTVVARAVDAGDNPLVSDDRGFIVVDLDTDQDLVCDPYDNCVEAYNPNQEDWNDDGIGDHCQDSDGDTILDAYDNCVTTPNPNQEDWNDDGIGDHCQDSDGDTVLDIDDNCVTTPNPNQEDWNGDGIGDHCQDYDEDTILDIDDNCVETPNTDQADWNNDGEGDVCDDTDGDTIFDAYDNCLLTPNTDQSDIDADLYGDACDNCPDVYNPGQEDSNGNGIGDACENPTDDDTADDDTSDDDTSDDDTSDDDTSDDDTSDDDTSDDDTSDDDTSDDDTSDDDTSDDDTSDDDTTYDDDSTDDDTTVDDDDTSLDDDTADDDDTGFTPDDDDTDFGDDDEDNMDGGDGSDNGDESECCGC